MEVSQDQGWFLWGPYTKDYRFLVSILGPPYFLESTISCASSKLPKRTNLAVHCSTCFRESKGVFGRLWRDSLDRQTRKNKQSSRRKVPVLLVASVKLIVVVTRNVLLLILNILYDLCI